MRPTAAELTELRRALHRIIDTWDILESGKSYEMPIFQGWLTRVKYSIEDARKLLSQSIL